MKITDKMRLDFLATGEAVHYDKDYISKQNGEQWLVGDDDSWHPSLREAIDAAIRASKRGGRK